MKLERCTDETSLTENETLNCERYKSFMLPAAAISDDESRSACERFPTSKNVLFQSLEVTVMTTLPVAGSRSISQRIVQHRALPLSQSCAQTKAMLFKLTVTVTEKAK